MMINKVRCAIEKYNMFPKDSTVVAAVSGGSDSMALLLILNSLKNEYGFRLIAAHVNHGLRAVTAERDENFVRTKCASENIELHVLKADVASLAKEKGIGLEECGRNVRYDFFNSLGENVIIATAHNLSDRAETFLFNFARGSSLRGLCSIPPVRDNVVRPLIGCTKEEIVSFCKENSIEYVNDETNDDVKYSRNRIRHNIITELKKINPSFEFCAERCFESLNEDERYLHSLAVQLVGKAKKENGYDALLLSASPLPIKKRAVTLIVENEFSVTPEYKSVEKICALLSDAGKTQINGGLTARVRKGILDFPSEQAKTDFSPLGEGATFFADAIIETYFINIDETNNLQNFLKQDLDYYLDCDKIIGSVVVRSRISGDKITLKTRNCTKTLKKLFNELSVLPEKRNSVAVFADDKGVILVEGAGCDRRVAVTKETRKVMCLKIKRNNKITGYEREDLRHD